MSENGQRTRWLEGRWTMAAILTAYVALGVAYSMVVPAYEAPDEPAHLAYVWYLNQYRRFPVQQPVYEENLSAEGLQPPLYYLLGALATAPISGEMRDLQMLERNPCFAWRFEDPGWQTALLHTGSESFPYHGVWLGLHIVRWLSLVLGVVTVWATYHLGRAAAPDRRWLALAGAAVVAFTPQFLFLHSTVNNDNLATALSSLILLASARAVVTPSRDRDWAWMGLLLGLGALTKYSVYALAPLPFGVLAWRAWRDRDWRRATRRLLWLVALPLLIAGWWYARNQALYGDPLAWRVMLDSLGQYVSRVTPLSWADLREFGLLTFTTYWARFGWMSLPVPDGVYIVLAIVCGLGMVGTVVDLWQHRWRWSPVRWVLVLAVLGVGVSLLRYLQVINNSGYQGRFLFPVSSALSLLLLIGLSRLAGAHWAAPVCAGFGIGLLVLSIGALWGVIYPAYAPPARYQATSVAGLPQPCVRFGGELELAAYRVEPTVLRPGDELALTLYWHVLEAPPGPVALSAELVDAGRRLLDAAGSSAPDWQPGELVATEYGLRVPEHASPSAALLVIRATRDGPLAVSSLGGRSLGDAAELGGLKIAPSLPVQAPSRLTTYSFAHVAALRGYDLDAAQVQANGVLGVTLYWESLGTASVDYTVLVHLLDERAHPVAQADGQPLGGAYPTTLWSTGEWIVDRREVSLRDVPPGDYALGVGWYLLQTGERLPAHDATYDRLPDDVAILCPVRVVQEEGP